MTAGRLSLALAALLIAASSWAVAAQPSGLETHTVVVDGHPLTVWARRPASARGAVLLVHGRTWSGRPDFDLQVPGLQRSVLASLAARGIAAYAVDLRGYGATARDSTGWLTPMRSAADVRAVLAWVALEHPTIPRPVVVGWSRGAAISMLAAQGPASPASALVLFGFSYDPDSRFADTAAPPKPVRARNTAASARSDFISPAVTSPAVVRAFVAQALRSDPIAADVKGDAEFNALDPRAVSIPVLFVYGERDIAVSSAEVAAIRARLGRSRATVVVLPGADHAAHLENTHDSWVDAVVALVDSILKPS